MFTSVIWKLDFSKSWRASESYSRGQPSRLWTRKVGVRAEALGAMVYALAVRGIVSVDLDRREGELMSGRQAGTADRVQVDVVNR